MFVLLVVKEGEKGDSYGISGRHPDFPREAQRSESGEDEEEQEQDHVAEAQATARLKQPGRPRAGAPFFIESGHVGNGVAFAGKMPFVEEILTMEKESLSLVIHVAEPAM